MLWTMIGMGLSAVISGIVMSLLVSLVFMVAVNYLIAAYGVGTALTYYQCVALYWAARMAAAPFRK